MGYCNERHGFYSLKQKELGTPEKTGGCPTLKKSGDVTVNAISSIIYKTSNIKPIKFEKIGDKKET